MRYFFSQKLLLSIVSFTLLLQSVFAQKSGDWIFKSEKDGVKVYYRKTSDVYEIKMLTTMKATLSGAVQLLNEVDNYPVWGYKISEAKLLQQVNEREFYYYSKLDFPWPLSDRDIVVHSKMEQDSTTKKITSTGHAKPSRIPEQKGVVRIKTTTTRWTITPSTSGQINIEYYIHSNPGGNIPDWLVNMAIDMGPRETLNGMRKILQQPKYQAAKLAYIKD
ncbi:MAG: hypothetical protein KF734_15265 [Saprospiraceae bacterium]|nr:hypothetical protein [Saprospiraceae bacterium]